MPPPQLLGKHVAPALVLAVGHEPGGRGSGGLVPRPMCFEVEMLVGGPEVDFSNCDIAEVHCTSLFPVFGEDALPNFSTKFNGWQRSVCLAKSVLMAVGSLVITDS